MGSNSGGQFSASSIDLLIGNLAVADLVVTFFCNITEVVWALTIQWYAGKVQWDAGKVQWYAGNIACKLVKFIQPFGLYLSTYTIVVIAVDRCSAVLDPLRNFTRVLNFKLVLHHLRPFTDT